MLGIEEVRGYLSYMYVRDRERIDLKDLEWWFRESRRWKREVIFFVLNGKYLDGCFSIYVR